MLLSAGVWRSWSRNSSGAIKKKCRISRSWNMQRRLLSISSNWGGKTRYFIYLHWLHALSNNLFIKWNTKSIYHKCSIWVSGWMFLVFSCYTTCWVSFILKLMETKLLSGAETWDKIQIVPFFCFWLDWYPLDCWKALRAGHSTEDSPRWDRKDPHWEDTVHQTRKVSWS